MAGGDFVSVIIPAYNAAQFLPETLESVLSQSHENREIIVVDDGSTDDTVEVIAPYLQRIRLIQRDHAGIGPTRNAGIDAAEGDYIAFIDADDLWLPDKLAVQLEVARRHPESGLIACDGVEFDGPRVTKPHLLSDSVIGAMQHAARGEVTADFYRAFIRNCMISCPAQLMLPRQAIDDIRPLKISWAQDYEICLRASRLYPVTFHADQLVCWRYSSGSVSGPRDNRNVRWAEMGLQLFESEKRRSDDDAERGLYARRIKSVIRLKGLTERRQAPGGSGLRDRLASAGFAIARRINAARELYCAILAIRRRDDQAREAGLGLWLRQTLSIMLGRPVGD